ncbi:hypothetical protein Patl1_07994 [Pistacia atlantica]|uniref:Uncharacterized protein n=1 Tax=Pistacia atlantica TaxID=434234 RepID=A0ACC1AGK7_9ROSI|nr:hypothetical protein Patl1_07994 [Pistacia atlantica]
MRRFAARRIHSQLYTQAMNHQKHSFQAGERHGLEKFYQWIWRQEEGGSRVTTVDILNYLQVMVFAIFDSNMSSLQNELDYSGKEPSMSPRAQVRHQHAQPTSQLMSSGFPVSSGSSGQITGQGTRTEHCDQQSRNSVFSNALSSPIRRSLQHYHIAQGGGLWWSASCHWRPEQ